MFGPTAQGLATWFAHRIQVLVPKAVAVYLLLYFCSHEFFQLRLSDTFEFRSVRFRSRHNLGTIWSAHKGWTQGLGVMRGVVGRTQSQAFEGVFGQSSQESRHVRVSWLSFSLVTFFSGSGFQPVFQVSKSAGRSKTRPLFYHGKRRSTASRVGHIVFVLNHRVALPPEQL